MRSKHQRVIISIIWLCVIVNIKILHYHWVIVIIIITTHSYKIIFQKHVNVFIIYNGAYSYKLHNTFYFYFFCNVCSKWTYNNEPSYILLKPWIMIEIIVILHNIKCVRKILIGIIYIAQFLFFYKMVIYTKSKYIIKIKN